MVAGGGVAVAAAWTTTVGGLETTAVGAGAADTGSGVTGGRWSDVAGLGGGGSAGTLTVIDVTFCVVAAGAAVGVGVGVGVGATTGVVLGGGVVGGGVLVPVAAVVVVVPPSVVAGGVPPSVVVVVPSVGGVVVPPVAVVPPVGVVPSVDTVPLDDVVVEVLPVVGAAVPSTVDAVPPLDGSVVPVAGAVVPLPDEVVAVVVVGDVESSAAAGPATASAATSVHSAASSAAAVRIRPTLAPRSTPTDTLRLDPAPLTTIYQPARPDTTPGPGGRSRAKAYENGGGTFSRGNLASSRVGKGALCSRDRCWTWSRRDPKRGLEGQMGGKAGLGGRVLAAALLVGALLFAFAGTGSADGQWTIAIGNASPSSSPEGDTSTNTLVFPVTVTGPAATPQDMSVSYTSSEGLTPAFTIPAGTASGAVLSLAVPINGNTTPEDDRTMTVTLTGGTFGGGDTTDTVAVGSPPSGTGKIIDDDWRITGLSSDPSNATASEAGGTIDFKVTLNANAPADHPITIDYALADGSGAKGAKLGTDYTVSQPSGKQTGTLTFAPGTNVVDVKVQGKNDNLYGYDKTFTMSISNPVGATYAANAPTSETGTITEASDPPTIGFSSGCPTVTGGNLLTIPIRTGGTTSLNDPIPASVTWTTSDNTTVAGDYNGGTGTATVPAGSRDGSINIQTNENPPSGNRTFTVTLSNPQQATILSGAGSVSCTITQPANAGADKLPSVQVADPAPVAQPGPGGAPVTVPITVTLNPPVLTPATPSAVDLHWATKDGSATAPSDYKSDSGSLHWDAGVYNAQSFNVTVNPATGTASAPIKFTIQFQTTSAGFVGSNVVTVTVVPPASPPALSVANASAVESAGSIPAVVSLAPSSTSAVTVQYSTVDGSAKAGSDYTAVNGTLTFQPGQVTKTVLVPIANDNQVDPSRSFTFKLSTPTNAMLGTANATMTILDDDAASSLPPLIHTAPPQPKPQPVPQQQPTSPTGKHVVLVQLLTGQSTVDSKGYAHFKLSCPAPAVKACQGTIVLQVRVVKKTTSKGAKANQKGKKKDPPTKTVTVASGKFKIKVGKTASVKVKVTKGGLVLLRSYKRIKVKATVRATDAQKVKGVTAWFVTVQAPARSITIKTK